MIRKRRRVQNLHKCGKGSLVRVLPLLPFSNHIAPTPDFVYREFPWAACAGVVTGRVDSPAIGYNPSIGSSRVLSCTRPVTFVWGSIVLMNALWRSGDNRGIGREGWSGPTWWHDLGGYKRKVWNWRLVVYGVGKRSRHYPIVYAWVKATRHPRDVLFYFTCGNNVYRGSPTHPHCRL